jgi:hypothetical protein
MTCTGEAGGSPGAGRRGRRSGRVVTIAGRTFRLGAAYASAIPPAKAADGPRVPRRLVSFDPAFGWPGGLVVAELRPPAPGRKPRRLRVSGEAWARWAGEEVGS